MPAAVENSTSNSLEPWLQLALQGATVVTSNTRAARFLLHQAGQLAQSQGHLGWHSPRILAWSAWIGEAWQQTAWKLNSPSVLLGSEQENMLWGRLLASRLPGSHGNASPLNLDSLAGLAQQAWALLHDHADGVASLRGASTHRADWDSFQQWARAFSKELNSAGLITRVEIPARLVAELASEEWEPEPRLVFWAFDEFTPSQQRLVAALRERCDVQIAGPAGQPAPLTALRFAAQQDEFHAATAWAKLWLHQNPKSRLAIMTTKAAVDRGPLYRALSSQLPRDAFAFALGHPLPRFSMVRTALQLLAWPVRALTAPEISELLLSPALAQSDSDLRSRAAFEAARFRQRDLAAPAMRLGNFANWLRNELQRHPSPSLTVLLRQCQAAHQVLPRTAIFLTAEDWADRFRAILVAFEFPSQFGRRSSEEFQTADRWSKLLDEFSTLGILGETLSAEQALLRLDRMAADVTFQPESSEAPVQIMGPLEAAGSLFDGIFFTGFSDDRWPISSTSNPLLPTELQRAYAMPGAARGADREQARAMLDRLRRSCAEIYVSSPVSNPEGPVRPSAVLTHAAVVGPDVCELDIESSSRLFPRPAPILCATEDLSEASPPPWDFSRAHLSSSVLKSQAACPFQAFALQRLFAREGEFPEDGFDALQRGNMMHALLQDVWCGDGGLQDSAGLRRTIEDDSLDRLILAKAAGIVVSASTEGGWEGEFAAIERDRLAALVNRWLREVEAMRVLDFRVVAVEQKHEFNLLGAMQFHVRVDRVDALGAGNAAEKDAAELILIDYKSTRPEAKAWTTPRMDEPQLPLYAVRALANAPVALAFATLRGGNKPCMTGISERAGILKFANRNGAMTPRAFNDQMAEWRLDIDLLAREFAEGEARVFPKHGGKTCSRCNLQALCRVHERDVVLDQPDDELTNEATNETTGETVND